VKTANGVDGHVIKSSNIAVVSPTCVYQEKPSGKCCEKADRKVGKKRHPSQKKARRKKKENPGHPWNNRRGRGEKFTHICQKKRGDPKKKGSLGAARVPSEKNWRETVSFARISPDIQKRKEPQKGSQEHTRCYPEKIKAQ